LNAATRLPPCPWDRSKVIGRLAREVIEAQQAGAEVGVVIGDGNIFRNRHRRQGRRDGEDVRQDKSKPAEILEKIIGGKIAKIVNEVTLYGQPYVLDTDKSVEAVLKAAGAEVVSFQRLAVGEGIEKVVEDYAAEVMKQAGLA
jgi:translation elongation factor EF-Ts